MRDDERMDELIDAALRSYAEPGEIPGARVVLARVRERAAERARRLGWWMGLVGAAACAVVLVVVGLVMTRGPRKPEIAWVPRAPGVAAGTGVQVQPFSGRDSARLKSCPDARTCSGAAGKAVAGGEIRGTRGPAEDVAAGKRLPKLEVFPTPRPLSAEEQALVAFATQGPPEVKKAVIEDQKHWDDPIIVAGFEQQPLGAGQPQAVKPQDP